MSVLREVIRGVGAGAAGTTALNATTYLDMAVRGRPSSSTPEQSVERLAEQAHVPIPGNGETRRHRVEGLGPLLGIAAGLAAGAVVGAARGAGLTRGYAATAAAASGLALVAGNGPMTVLGVTDPRRWSRADWLADLVPHAVYGAVTAGMLHDR